MIGFKEAVEIAKAQYRMKGVETVKIGTVYETDGKWILFRDPGERMQLGTIIVLVDKENGETELKGFPSQEMNRVLHTARKVQ